MKLTMKNFVLIMMICIGFLSLTACNSTETQTKSTQQKQIVKTITIKKQKTNQSLFLNGTVMPIKTSAVISPMEGTIVSVYFSYGQNIKKNQLLARVKSSSLDKNYQTAVSTFLTAKEKYNSSKANIVGAKDLYDSGITSRQTYDSALNTLYDNYLSYLRAEHSLIHLLEQAGVSGDKLYMLKIGNQAAVKKALESPLREISIRASSNGIALLPTKQVSGDSSSSGAGTKIQIGSEVKSGQMLLSIGQLSGLKVKVDVAEVDINKVKKGDKAIITSAAFPGITLNGEVQVVSRQAQGGSSGSLPTFPVTVTVKSLTAKEKEIIHVGMTAKVQIELAASDVITIPISAVKVVNGQAYVGVVDPKTGKTTEQKVETGTTSVSGVVIMQGLKPGDKIVVSN